MKFTGCRQKSKKRSNGGMKGESYVTLSLIRAKLFINITFKTLRLSAEVKATEERWTERVSILERKLEDLSNKQRRPAERGKSQFVLQVLSLMLLFGCSII